MKLAGTGYEWKCKHVLFDYFLKRLKRHYHYLANESPISQKMKIIFLPRKQTFIESKLVVNERSVLKRRKILFKYMARLSW